MKGDAEGRRRRKRKRRPAQKLAKAKNVSEGIIYYALKFSPELGIEINRRINDQIAL